MVYPINSKDKVGSSAWVLSREVALGYVLRNYLTELCRTRGICFQRSNTAVLEPPATHVKQNNLRPLAQG